MLPVLSKDYTYGGAGMRDVEPMSDRSSSHYHAHTLATHPGYRSGEAASHTTFNEHRSYMTNMYDQDSAMHLRIRSGLHNDRCLPVGPRRLITDPST